MSMPNIPDVNINRVDAINILLASIGFEELALAHILNAEGEKLQYVLGTLEGRDPGEVTICDVLEMNNNVNQTIRSVIKMEMLLQFKLEDILAQGEGENYVDFEFIKTDADTGLPLAGATFEVRKGTTVYGQAVSDADGKVAFTNLLPGTYTLVETIPPDDYDATKDTYVLVIDTNGDITIDGTPLDQVVISNTPAVGP